MRTRLGDPPALLGPGDDAALLAAPDGRVVASTDLLVEGRHFRRDWQSAHDVGRRAAAQNLADIAAMGAVPTGLLVGLVVPADLPSDWVADLAGGLAAECALLGVGVVGGDLTAGPLVTVAVTALGDLGGRPPVLRSGARAGDLIVVAGRLGWSATGLAGLAAGRPVEPFAEAFRRPQPPYAAGPALARTGATAMLDVSDGLLADLGHLARASGVAVDVRLASVRTVAGPDVGDREALTGGEDHALAAAVPPDRLPELAAAVPDAVVVGEVAAGSGVTVDGSPWPGAAGFDHFATGSVR